MNNLTLIKPSYVQNIINKFCYTIGMLPTSYKMSLTYEEQILAIGNYLETTVYPAINSNAEALAELQNLFIELKSYVNTYFDNLDVQTEINNKLEEMAKSGELQEIIINYVKLNGVLSFNTVQDMINSTSIVENSTVKTLGQDSFNDGLGRFYKIEKIQNATGVDDINLINLGHDDLYARLIIEGYLNTITNLSNTINGISQNLPLTKMKPKLIAHRGASLEAPENTLPAFRIAGQQKFYGCETDIIESADGQFYCFHDDTVDRMTTGTGAIRTMTSSQIENLIIDNGTNIDNYPNLHVPSLYQYLEICYTYGLVPIIELKNINNVHNFYNILKSYNFENKAIVISFSLQNLQTLRSIDANIKIQALLDLTNDNINYCVTNKFDIDFPVEQFNGLMVDYAHIHGLEVNTWTLNDNTKTVELYGSFIDYLTTNANVFAMHNNISPLYCNNQINLWLENELNELAINGTDFYNGDLKSILSRAYGETTLPYPTNMLFSTNRCMCLNKIKLRTSSTINYNIPANYKMTIQPYNSNGLLIQDLGWFSGNSHTNFPAGTTFGIASFAKVDNSYISEVDKNNLRKIITNVTY